MSEINYEDGLQEQPYAPPEGYPKIDSDIATNVNMVSSHSGYISPFSGTNEYSTSSNYNQNVSPIRNYGHVCDVYGRPQSSLDNSSSNIDPTLLSLQGFFKELYVRRREWFKKIFSASLLDKFVKILKKMGSFILSLGVSSQTRHIRHVKNKNMKTLRRSLSVGSQRGISSDYNVLRPQRFKVRTVVYKGDDAGSGGAAPPGGQGDHDDFIKSDGSK